MFAGREFTPASIQGSAKYGNSGNCKQNMFQYMGLPEHISHDLAGLGNFSLARSTWSTYKSSERLLLMCQSECKKKFDWPVTVENVLIFVHWLVFVRGVKGSTVSSYLSGLRQLHILKGMDAPNLRPDIVKMVIKGKEHQDRAERREGTRDTRLPMTVELMKALKEKIRTWDKPWNTRLLIWAVSTMAFHGAFRIHELLCRTESFFDPQYTLLTEHVTMTTDNRGRKILHVKLNCPKEQKNGQITIVDIFESGCSICPIKAFTRWKDRQEPKTGMPLFRQPDGTPLTGRKLNSILGNLMADKETGTRKIRTHSFRIGVTSELGYEGFDDEEVKAGGRWSSRAFETYMRTPRTQRANIARKIAELGNRRGRELKWNTKARN